MKHLYRPLAHHHLGFICSALLLGCLFTAQTSWLSINTAFAQTPPTSDLEGRTIAEIQVKGNTRVATSTILAKISSKPGQPYQDQTVNQDIKSILKLRGIQTVYYSADFPRNQLVLLFIVVEEPLLSSIQFAGNRRFSDDELHKLLVLRPGDFADSYLLARGREALLAHYRKAGYDRAEVTLEIAQGNLIYSIVEGPRIRIRKIT